MRDLVYKNLTSGDKKKKIVASSEVLDRQGIHSVVHRHFICIIKEVKDAGLNNQQQPYVYILKKRDTREQKEEFFCRIKGSVFAVSNGKLFMVLFMHSLKINLSSAENDALGLGM